MTSAEKIKDSIVDLRRMVEIIRSEGHTMATDWIEPAYERANKGVQLNAGDWRKVYKDNMAAIAKSDVFIAESTLRSFGTGYQVAISVRSKKPTLILRRDDMQDDMSAGIDEEHIKFQAYNVQTLENIMITFLKENDISTKDLRFNFSIDRKIHNYLRWASLKSGETKAEVIRKLIEREIDNSGL
jgi:hypothetical protein